MSHRPTSRRAWLAFALLPVAIGAWAAEGEHREHGAHVHGHGSLEVVAEGDELLIELHVPGVNVVGFEHEPSTDEQRNATGNALALFRGAANLFAPSESARCEVKAVDVELGPEEHHAGEEEHEEHEEHEHEEGMHTELHGEYHFRCAAPEKLERLRVRVMEPLLNAEELDVRIVTPRVQTAVELHPGEDDVVKLTP